MARGKWQSVVCDGCPLCCRYADFRVYTRHGFAEEAAALWKDTDDSSCWVYKRRGTILGRMHAHKLELWREKLAMCPSWRDEAEDA